MKNQDWYDKGYKSGLKAAKPKWTKVEEFTFKESKEYYISDGEVSIIGSHLFEGLFISRGKYIKGVTHVAEIPLPTFEES